MSLWSSPTWRRTGSCVSSSGFSSPNRPGGTECPAWPAHPGSLWYNFARSPAGHRHPMTSVSSIWSRARWRAFPQPRCGEEENRRDAEGTPGAIGEPAARQAPRQGCLDRCPSTPRIDALAQVGRRLLNVAPETPCSERKEAVHDVSEDTGRCCQRCQSLSRTFNGLPTLNKL
jgi:hypothetical protein